MLYMVTFTINIITSNVSIYTIHGSYGFQCVKKMHPKLCLGHLYTGTQQVLSSSRVNLVNLDGTQQVLECWSCAYESYVHHIRILIPSPKLPLKPQCYTIQD